MKELLILYVFFTGCVYTSWIWELKDNIWLKVLTISFGFTLGWLMTPVLIGGAIKKIYKS